MAASISEGKYYFLRFMFLGIFVIFDQLIIVQTNENQGLVEDILIPYLSATQLPHRSHRRTRECQPFKYNNITSESYTSHQSHTILSSPVDIRYIIKEVGSAFDRRVVFGHEIVVNDPLLTFSVLEPGRIGGCEAHIRETVRISSETTKNCLVATNAGFFNITDFACMGNVVSDGRLVHDTNGIQNVHFGIRKNGTIFVGYISEEDRLMDSFAQLIGGVVWLVRNGEPFIDVSKLMECPDMQTAGVLQKFIDIKSGRTALGHDADGRIVIVQIDGKTGSRGMNLYEFTDMLISMGLVNAINVDGGGSTTAVENGVVINYPSDMLNGFGVARKVSTILCVSDYPCATSNCSGHGRCLNGACVCTGRWSGASCAELSCIDASNCTNHGICTEEGCECSPGWTGLDCSLPCPVGWYGSRCSLRCTCSNETSTGCHPASGKCFCSAGYTGHSCDRVCSAGTYGEECEGRCKCDGGCFCHHVTGSCDQLPEINSSFYSVNQCWGDLVVVSKLLLPVSSKDFWLWQVTLALLSSFCAVSFILNIVLVCKFTCCRKTRSPSKTRSSYVAAPSRDESDSSVDPFEDEEAIALEPLRTVKRPDKKVNRTKYKTRALRNKSRNIPAAVQDVR